MVKSVSTAEKLFLERDSESTSMDDILREAGLTKRTIYQYFTSKEGLFYAVALKGTRQFISACEEAYKNRKNALRAFKNEIIRFYMDIIAEGKSDGSINTKLDTKNAVYFGLLSSIGLLNMVAQMEGSFIWGNEGLDKSGFLLFSMDLLANALK